MSFYAQLPPTVLYEFEEVISKEIKGDIARVYFKAKSMIMEEYYKVKGDMKVEGGNIKLSTFAYDDIPVVSPETLRENIKIIF